ncbi:putative TIM-barrel fold metal-dependent hydrolase [Amycolatopsis echigonensis]|uniref:TIM-barrel fold metal-dependent hydrolase n=1 Tax=Amycolatopsis echigonensis TaxID=2576905 RepID=A0A2N3WRD7_9PSEU|nr:amidohydrolase family protein [Amycolatopsis niigatensis]PKV96436.1 putative TIM-barrel fold metal-dependent hydrolase [Amycolatopsis niigatensis]
MILPPRAIDGHAHVFRRGLPTAAEPRYVPDYDATSDEYLALLDEHGIAGALLVQPSFLGVDNEFLLACLRRCRDRFRAVVVLDGPGDLAPLSVDGVAGTRLNLIDRAVPELTAPAWQRLGAELARSGQHLEVQASDEHWTALAPALRHWPSPVVLDHLGLPGTSAEADRAVLDLAQLGHVWIKASAPYRSPRGAATTMLGRILAEAGPHRLLWGSDWPWTRHEHRRTYASCLAWLTDHLDQQTLHAVVAHNATRLLHWSPEPVPAPAPTRGTRTAEAMTGGTNRL